MPAMNSSPLRFFVKEELRCASRFDALGHSRCAFRHLERAHVLGQHSTIEHVRVHGRMLGWAWRHRDHREIAGQLLRIVGAAAKTALGLVPTGNTGGSNVSPFRPMPIPLDLQRVIDATGARQP